jgi:hypothetical protein
MRCTPQMRSGSPELAVQVVVGPKQPSYRIVDDDGTGDLLTAQRTKELGMTRGYPSVLYNASILPGKLNHIHIDQYVPHFISFSAE